MDSSPAGKAESSPGLPGTKTGETSRPAGTAESFRYEVLDATKAGDLLNPATMPRGPFKPFFGLSGIIERYADLLGRQAAKWPTLSRSPFPELSGIANGLHRCVYFDPQCAAERMLRIPIFSGTSQNEDRTKSMIGLPYK